MAALLAVAAVVLGLLPLVGSGGGGDTTVAVLRDGPLQIGDDGRWRSVAVGSPIPLGAELRAAGDAVALELFDGGRLQLLPDTGAEIAGVRRLTLVTGTVLVADTDLTVAVGAVRAHAPEGGAWRVDVGDRTRIAGYDAEVVATDGVARRTLPTYAEVAVRDGALDNGPVPLRYQADDPFDAVHLVEAFRIDELASALTRSLAAEHGSLPRTPEFYTSFLTVDDVMADRLAMMAPEVVGDRLGPPADVLLAATAVDALAEQTEYSRDQAVDQVVQARSAGASWGVVLLRGGADAAALRAAADRALERAAQDPPATEPSPPTDGPAAGAPSVSRGSGSEADGATSVDQSPAAGTSTPSPAARGGAVGDPGDDADEGSGGTRDGRSGGVPRGGGGDQPEAGDGTEGDDTGDPGPSPAPTPPPPIEDAAREAGDLLGDLIDGAGGVVGGVVGGVDELLRPLTGPGR